MIWVLEYVMPVTDILFRWLISRLPGPHLQAQPVSGIASGIAQGREMGRNHSVFLQLQSRWAQTTVLETTPMFKRELRSYSRLDGEPRGYEASKINLLFEVSRLPSGYP